MVFGADTATRRSSKTIFPFLIGPENPYTLEIIQGAGLLSAGSAYDLARLFTRKPGGITCSFISEHS
jgi:hypothetical protein